MPSYWISKYLLHSLQPLLTRKWENLQSQLKGLKHNMGLPLLHQLPRPNSNLHGKEKMRPKDPKTIRDIPIIDFQKKKKNYTNHSIKYKSQTWKKKKKCYHLAFVDRCHTDIHRGQLQIHPYMLHSNNK